MKARENLLVDFRSKLQKIIISYQNLYVNSDVDREDFLKVSVRPLNEEVARLTASTVNEQVLEEDMIFDKEFTIEVTAIGLGSVTDFLKNVKDK